ncbi:uncharacterized protein LOC122510679 [Leptopilina heterotoma]|uniref:uncharacterized protein LOC122510679 n=1 Tax=Leptopilina heterotoma TaxID=63436 RepID=UPI001CA9C60D|nr:uncharacterized protein LOC122510679 [Leptopilina heterotoma]
MGEPEDSKITSTQKTLSSSHDSGWNDPPMRAFSATKSSCTTPTKRLLNKRVAFPLNSTANTSNLSNQTPMPIPSNLPPPLSCKEKINNSPLQESSNGEQEERDSNSFILKEDLLKEVLVNLDVLMEKYVHSETSQDVRKRIEIMRNLLIDKKLDNDIQTRILNLLKALNAEDVEKADKLQISLMMARGSSCSSWLPGIRHLIFEMKSKITKNDTVVNSDTDTSLISTLSLE